MAYAACVTLGAILALLVRRWAPKSAYPNAPYLGAVALVGALSGAALLELPADWMGWTARLAGEPIRLHALGGRTVLGGILGGWIAVEAAKPALGIATPTGDGFAAPLAVALACGRVGCAIAGCCPGKALDGGSWWAPIAVRAADGALRFPAAIVECAFHAVAAIALLLVVRRGLLAGRALAAYVAAYAVVRMLLELVRDNPKVIAGLTYYQILAVPLFVLAAATFVVRGLARRPPTPAHAG